MVNLSGTGGDNSVTLVVSAKGKSKVTECADFISVVGKGIGPMNIDCYVEETQHVSSEIPTGTITKKKGY